MNWLLLALGALSAALAINAYRPIRWPAAAGLVSFFAGWLVGDLPVVNFLLQAAMASGLVWFGALEGWPGWTGLALLVVGWAGLVRAYAESVAAEEAMEEALASVGVPPQPVSAWSWWTHLLPFFFWRRNVRRVGGIPIEKIGMWTLKADVYHPKQSAKPGPVLVFVHGGGWVVSFRQFQGLPVLTRLAAAGWTCISISYRLSPVATFPDHLIDVKRGIAWARENAHRFGGDPAFLAIHGNSAGAHLSALAALTPNDPRYQPGFEEVDTSVDVCVPVYGPLDLEAHVGGHLDFRLMMEWIVLKASRSKDPQLWRDASPAALLHEDAPPFFMVHGSADSLVPIEGGRKFFAACKNTLKAPVGFAEIPGGQHALDIFHSRRGVAVAEGIRRYLEHAFATFSARAGRS